MEESPFSSELLKTGNREKGILKDKNVNTISNKNLTKKKKRRKNKKQRHSSQTIIEKQTSSTSLVLSLESLDDTYKDGLNLKTAINEQTEEDKAQEEPEISKNIETESNPNEELISIEKKQPLEVLKNDSFSIYQEEAGFEDDIMPYLMSDTKQQLREFIARLYVSAKKDHKELKTLKKFIENLILTNQALRKENTILKNYPKS
ncbi:hypothetical protein [Candidatus Odyssella acanthamoebae]|uniref:Uncharacterized protein n=1 Tax=Candidatus Odyssella acanthamoebae TaxID=91604 RepID=A0A077AUA6_9PROT|nr:hypothetical protein [Candidatus Paracaedibacter acanthamoebae]AIK95609.1 hypothetical protein ID47_00810 [Candidatus Paracaedibacter acanthamoebae]